MTDGFVLDASVAGPWGLRDEVAPLAEAALARLRTDWALVPSLFWFELRNLLLVNERRGRIGSPQTEALLAQLAAFEIETDRSPSWPGVMGLARDHGLTVYDAAYLELARRRAVPLATLDRRLARAAAAVGVEPLAA